MVTSVSIAGRPVGPGAPCFVIAEAGVNHNGRLDVAKQLIEVAARAGADAVKFQTFRAERLATANSPKAAYQRDTTNPEESQLEMLKRLELSPHDHHVLMDTATAHHLLFLSSPFDEESADLLASLDVPAFKVPSGELTNFPLLRHVARYGKPIILSTGMATLEEVKAALRVIEAAGNREIVILHCVSNYPTAPADANLRAMTTMANILGVPVGYSDHTDGIEVALAAVALGACVIEKHFTLDRSLVGPDHRASLEPMELTALVRGIRTVEHALGHGRKEPAPSEASTAAVARKSLVSARDIQAGTPLTASLITVKRPGTGLPPSMLEQLVGRRAVTDIPADTLLTLEMVQ